MRRLFSILILLICASVTQAQFAYPEESLLLLPFGFFVPVTIYSESFENTKPTLNGYDNASTETELLIDSDDTTAATSGSQNLKVVQNVGSTYVFPNAGWTPVSVITIDFSFKVDTIGADNQIIQLDDTPNGNGKCFIYILASGVMLIYGNSSGSVQATTIDTVSANTQYYCKATWNKINGTYQIEFNTTHFFNGNGNKFASNNDGDTGVTLGGLRYYSTGAGYTTKFDQMVITTP